MLTMKDLARWLLLCGSAAASPFDPLRRQQSCPQVHVFGARETTAKPGFGSSSTVVELVLKSFPGSTSEAIDYPAIGGQNYSWSVAEGIKAIVSQTTSFNAKCPDTKLVLVGYSQGAQIMDDAFCGGPDGQSLMNATVPIAPALGSAVSSLIWMGDPRHVDGLPYNFGNATLGGVGWHIQSEWERC